MQQTTDINLMPYILEAFSTNPTVYNHIDKIYNTNPQLYNTIANKSPYSNHYLAHQGTAIEDEYFKKSVGIFDQLTDDTYMDLLKKGWPYVYRYCKGHQDLLLDDLLQNALCVLGKNVKTDTILSYATIALQFSAILNIHFDQMHPKNYPYLERLQLRSHLYSNPSLYIEQKKNTYKDMVENFYSWLLKNNATTTLYRNSSPLAQSIDCLLTKNGLSILSLTENCPFSSTDYKNFLALFFTQHPELSNTDTAGLLDYIYIAQVITGLTYELKTTKLSLIEQKETLAEFNTLELNATIDTLRQTSTSLSEQNENLSAQLEASNREIASLRTQLEASTRDKKEIIALRNALYDTIQDEPIAVTSSISAPLADKGVFIGGSPTLINKLKPWLPDFTFISVDSLNFDVNIIKEDTPVYFYAQYLSHPLYYKCIDRCKLVDATISYINNTNIQLILNQIAA